MRYAARAAVLWSLLASSGCDKSSVIVNVEGQVDSLAVSEAALSMTVGDTIRLVATPMTVLGRATEGTVLWSSSNPAVASVDAEGLVRALNAGVTSIVASASGISVTVPTTVTTAVPTVAIRVDGFGRVRGPLPVVAYALADDATGADVYPLLSGAVYLFGLFDTGSPHIAIFSENPYDYVSPADPNGGLTLGRPNLLTDGNYFGSDVSHLALKGQERVRLRLNGLSAIDPDSLWAPFEQVSGSRPQIELTNVLVVPELPGSLRGDVTRLGGAITRRIVASIDYTTRVSRSGYDFYPGLRSGNRTPSGTGIPGFSPIEAVAGPDIVFFEPDDGTIPDLPLELELTLMGVKYAIDGITFFHGSEAVSAPDPTDPVNGHVLLDTGAPTTLVSESLGGELGLGGTGVFDCEGGFGNGFVLDSIRLHGAGGTYTVERASVCRVPPGRMYEPFMWAVVGANAFDQVPVVFDGSKRRLSVGQPAMSPVDWMSALGPSRYALPGGGLSGSPEGRCAAAGADSCQSSER